MSTESVFVCQSFSTKYCVRLYLILFINELDHIMKCFKCTSFHFIVILFYYFILLYLI